jgi:DNA repair protein RadC
MKMSDRRKDLRPREKLQARGAEALSDYELLMAIIGSGTQYADVTKLAREVQKLLKEKGSELAYEDLLNASKVLAQQKQQILWLGLSYGGGSSRFPSGQSSTVPKKPSSS